MSGVIGNLIIGLTIIAGFVYVLWKSEEDR
jgi:hypothetical protein